MKFSILTLLACLTFAQASIASPLMLKCRVNHAPVIMNIEDISGPGCFTKTEVQQQGTFLTRTNVTVCDGDQAHGTLETLNYQNQWTLVAELSTLQNCYLFRNIETNYNCPTGRQRTSDCY